MPPTIPYFPDLGDIEPTRKTMHLYTAAIGAVTRVHAIPHPKWWHISLKVHPDGLVTDSMPLPGGGSFALRMDLFHHNVLLYTSRGEAREFDMRQGLTGTEFGDRLLAAVGDLGLTGDYAHKKFSDDSAREYDPDAASRFFIALVNIDYLFKKHRASLEGMVSPVQLWPHNFDLAFEWFGSRRVEQEEHGRMSSHPSQLNLGFFPGEPEPYFYSNPWPFEEDHLLDVPLPEGASWHTEGWQGTYLPYASLPSDETAGIQLRNFARMVYEIASPTLI
jgi:Family of unknown function (DUF5996)